jgi:CheY-like chemotaxis protein
MNRCILVLDDEPWQLSWVDDVAAACGWRCVFAPTYDRAKALFDTESPEVVIVDIRIGDVSEPVHGATMQSADPSWVGLRFLNFIRVERLSPSTRIFVYTGLDRDALQRTVEGAFKASFYTKFEPELFQKALLSVLRKVGAMR